MISWNYLGKVAEEKLILLKSILSLLNSWEYMSTDEVFADPATPNKRQALLQVTDFSWFRIKSINFLHLKESRVGIKID